MAAEWLVTFANGETLTIPTVVGDIVAFELAHEGRSASISSMSDLTWLVWRGATRLGKTTDAFQDWADGVSDFDPVASAPLAPPDLPS